MLEAGYRSTFIRPLRQRWLAALPWAEERRSEPIELCRRRFGYQPARFRWRGVVYRVARIERVWEETARRGRAARRYFIVQCGPGERFTLFQDLAIGAWRLRTSPLRAR